MSIVSKFVSPKLGPNNEILSLLPMATREKIRARPQDPSIQTPVSIHTVSSVNISASEAIDLGFAGVVSFNEKLSGTYFLVDMVGYSHEQPGEPDSIIETQYYGYGARFCVKAWDLKAETKVNLEMVAAGCTVNASSSVVAVNTVGININAIAQITPLLSFNMGSFTEDSLTQLNVFFQALNDVIAQNPESITPQLLKVDLKTSALTDIVKYAPSTLYGLHRIDSGKSYDSAIENRPTSDLGKQIDPNVVYDIYRTIVGPDQKSSPNDAQKKIAHKAGFHKLGS